MRHKEFKPDGAHSNTHVCSEPDKYWLVKDIGTPAFYVVTGRCKHAPTSSKCSTTYCPVVWICDIIGAIVYRETAQRVHPVINGINRCIHLIRLQNPAVVLYVRTWQSRVHVPTARRQPATTQDPTTPRNHSDGIYVLCHKYRHAEALNFSEISNIRNSVGILSSLAWIVRSRPTERWSS